MNKNIELATSLISKSYQQLVLILAVAATLGSLYISDTMLIPACDLCWYQRVFAYSILPVAIVSVLIKDTKVYKYFLGLAVPGFVIAFYHVLVQTFQWEIYVGCNSSVPCSDVQLQLFGFLTIPMMSLLYFSAVSVVSLIAWRNNR